MMKQLQHFHKTKLGLLVFAIIELALAYAFASLAISHGILWWYLLTLIFLVGCLQNLVKFTGKLFHGK